MRFMMILLLSYAAAAMAGGIFIGSYVEGDWRYCKYDHGGGDIRIVRIEAVYNCPMSD
jgi:hypothetical protein